MADKKHKVKNQEDTQEADYALSQKYKWEQQLFVEALEQGNYYDAMSLLEATVKSPEAKQKWLLREDVKPHIYKYMAQIKANRHVAGNNKWEMHQKELDEFRDLIGIERIPQKIEVTVKPILGGLSKHGQQSKDDLPLQSRQ